MCYVRDFPAGSADQANPERLVRKRFSLRPRTAGLWLRLTLTDGDELEGLAANDRTLVDGAGLLLTPPDTRSNTQRIYVPRQAIEKLEVLSLIGVASRKRAGAARRHRPARAVRKRRRVIQLRFCLSLREGLGPPASSPAPIFTLSSRGAQRRGICGCLSFRIRPRPGCPARQNHEMRQLR